MSHFTVLVITKDKPTNVVIEGALAPFDENDSVENAKWDWWVLGGRWRGCLVPKNGAATLDGEPGVFRNEKHAPDGCDALRKGDLDLARTKGDPSDSIFPTFAVVDKEGAWHQRGEMGWWAIVTDERPKDEWHATFDRLLAETPDDHWLAIVDCHC